MDEETTVRQLMDLAGAFVAERQWQAYHTPKNLAMSVAIEAAELMEIFQWKTPEESMALAEDPAARQHMGEEIADVLAYLLNLADVLELDVSTGFREKMKKNADKYPKEDKITF